MLFNFFAAKRVSSSEVDTIDFAREEALHPMIADLVSAQEKAGPASAYDRDYGAKRSVDQMPVAFV